MKTRLVTQSEFSGFNQFGPSHMNWAGRNSLAAHVVKGLEDSPSASALRAFGARVDEHSLLRLQIHSYELQPTNALLVAADRKVDVTYSRFVGRIEDEPTLFGAASLRGQAAQRLLDGPLSMPVASVTNVERIEEAMLLQSILAEINAGHLADIETLGFNVHYQLLIDDTAEFIRQMTYDASLKSLPTRSELEERRKHLQALMLGCIYRIQGLCPDPTDEHLELRTALLGPFAIQNDRITAYHRNNRKRGRPKALAPEIDPATGEFADDLDEPAPG
ncbi:MAG: hypothetical protein H0U74_22020 [Bradymonadaceae bacterium]|nr:hypothetical protein [Lujinxingiaceae bacterium]